MLDHGKLCVLTLAWLACISSDVCSGQTLCPGGDATLSAEYSITGDKGSYEGFIWVRPTDNRYVVTCNPNCSAVSGYSATKNDTHSTLTIESVNMDADIGVWKIEDANAGSVLISSVCNLTYSDNSDSTTTSSTPTDNSTENDNSDSTTTSSTPTDNSTENDNSDSTTTSSTPTDNSTENDVCSGQTLCPGGDATLSAEYRITGDRGSYEGFIWVRPTDNISVVTCNPNCSIVSGYSATKNDTHSTLTIKSLEKTDIGVWKIKDANNGSTEASSVCCMKTGGTSSPITTARPGETATTPEDPLPLYLIIVIIVIGVVLLIALIIIIIIICVKRRKRSQKYAVEEARKAYEKRPPSPGMVHPNGGLPQSPDYENKERNGRVWYGREESGDLGTTEATSAIELEETVPDHTGESEDVNANTQRGLEDIGSDETTADGSMFNEIAEPTEDKAKEHNYTGESDSRGNVLPENEVSFEGTSDKGSDKSPDEGDNDVSDKSMLERVDESEKQSDQHNEESVLQAFDEFGDSDDDNESGGTGNDDNECGGAGNDDKECGGTGNDDKECGGTGNDDNECGGTGNDDNESGGTGNDDKEYGGTGNDDKEYGGTGNDDKECGGTGNTGNSDLSLHDPNGVGESV
ncbi:mucin-21-like isoform X2 [Haliotis rufescens]|uniref:mucin-21-like isoform X2 n=1 Tax=Haliotis rufescens TaxID=6454 RepID=UPI00201F9F2A|nr:mucin-21-like isoform X2 [Haliotis rufescens]